MRRRIRFDQASRALACGVAFLLFLAPAAFGQGCALCYTQAAGSGNRMIHALREGILILVIPPLLLSTAFTLMAYRRREQFREIDDRGDSWIPSWANSAKREQKGSNSSAPASSIRPRSI
ncbi:MAG TPA: hypothetical protein VMG31_04775 [Verrucomicrobiae bacterium]|nr:hypothetical protein [Verrucomicrobiae bacterium]